MTRRDIHRWVRKTHRYLGLILGIQFFLWTAGGLYFSWTNIDTIRGDNLKQQIPSLSLDSAVANLSQIQQEVKSKLKADSIESVQLVTVLGTTYYELGYRAAGEMNSVLADAHTGQLRSALSEKEAIECAIGRLKDTATIEKIEYLTETGPHHEYREKPLPAYAITFSGNVNTTVYVAAETGVVQTFRNDQWRIFDFLWMLHTMDYNGRDNINNWPLRVFSLLGLVAIMSGFVLFFVSLKKSKKLKVKS